MRWLYSYKKEISTAAFKYKIDPDLIRSVMYLETTHGYYDVVNPIRRTVLPMNIHYEYWKELAISESDMEIPAKNIEVGALFTRQNTTASF